MDVESRRPIDLLPDREPPSLAAGLARRPGSEGVGRDRAPFIAEGAIAGASQTVQVADRWLLWHNLRTCSRERIRDPPGESKGYAERRDSSSSPAV